MKIRSFLAAAAVVAAASVPTAALAASPTPSTAQVDGVSVSSSLGIDTKAELDSFILSSKPKTISVSAATGKVVAVTDSVSQVQPLTTTVTNVCNSGQACLVHSAVPDADFGFSGVGTKTGSWERRITWKTGKYTAKAWYSYNGTTVGWGPESGPNSVINIDRPVTAVKVTIYS